MWCSLEYYLRASGKILQDVLGRFYRAASIAGKAGKAGRARKLIFFEVFLEKLENDTFFKQHLGIAGKPTFLTFQFSSIDVIKDSNSNLGK